MKNSRIYIAFTALSIAISSLFFIPEVLAASAGSANFRMPPSADPGAVLSWEQRNFKLQQEQPFLFRPATIQDVTGIKETPIIFEEGVLPSEREVQGILITPGGSVIITPVSP